jgi:PHS family inorganic phosphate transporter-like MFS transporter
MGYAGDIFGRNTALLMTLSLVAASALLSAVAPGGPPTQVYTTIIVTRLFLGIGVGGVYPLSATKAAEDNSKKATGSDGESGDGVNISAAAFAFFWQNPGAMVYQIPLLLSHTCLVFYFYF